jgi:3-keto-disaccharide hydrolase
MRVLDTLPPEFWRGYQRATFPAGSWGCEAGMLRTVAEAEPMDLITRQQYRHFELTLEWRAARGGKSGILSRVTEALPHAWQSGIALQHHGAPVWFRHFRLRPLPDAYAGGVPATGPA